MSLSSEVKNLEDICTAYGKLFFIIKKELQDRKFDEFDDSTFLSKIEIFRTLKINKMFAYCPFPEDCSYYEKCTERYCGADICDNGYARKGY
jgi:hypothetical protein